MRGDYHFLDLMEAVLVSENRDMTLSEIWEVACQKKLNKKLASVGRTPINTMNSCVRRNIASKKNVRFVQTSSRPAKYNVKK